MNPGKPMQSLLRNWQELARMARALNQMVDAVHHAVGDSREASKDLKLQLSSLREKLADELASRQLDGAQPVAGQNVKLVH